MSVSVKYDCCNNIPGYELPIRVWVRSCEYHIRATTIEWKNDGD